MQHLKKYFLLAICFLVAPLSAGIYLKKPDHFNLKAVLGCCYLHFEDKILLLHRQDTKPEGNRWGIPGGKLDEGENLMDAVVREVLEETGIELDREKLHFIGKLYITVKNFHFEYNMVDYREPLTDPGAIKINFSEHKGFTWVTPEDAMKMDLMTDEATCFAITFGINTDS